MSIRLLGLIIITAGIILTLILMEMHLKMVGKFNTDTTLQEQLSVLLIPITMDYLLKMNRNTGLTPYWQTPMEMEFQINGRLILN